MPGASTEAATYTTQPITLSTGIAAPIVGAMAKISGLIKKEDLAKIIKDVSGMEKGYAEVKLRKFRKTRVEYSWGG